MSELPPQGILRFPGVERVIEFCYTLSHGITPGVASLKIAPQDDLPADPQTMTIEFGDTILEFPFCIIDKASITRSSKGMIVSVAIKDRRWAWQYTDPISGRYNIRLKGASEDDTQSIDEATKKNPQELAELLLEAMGEEDYDASALSTLPSPEVDWIYANPATELAHLAESLGCRVVLRLDGSVLIALLGEGDDLPDGGVRTVGCGIDPPDKPDKLMVVGAKTRYQSTFRLRAIGREPDEITGGTEDPAHPRDRDYPPVGFITLKPGDLKPIEDLSYNPDGTVNGFKSNWTTEDGFENIRDVRARKCAQDTVFKWYRIMCTADVDEEDVFNIPGYDGNSQNVLNIQGFGNDGNDVENVWQVLPLEDGLVDTYKESVVAGVQQDLTAQVETPFPPQITGKWFTEAAHNKPMEHYTRFPYPVTIDKERGIVKFPFAVTGRDSDGNYGPAELYLTIGHCVKDIETLQDDRFTKERTLEGEERGVGTQVLHRPDVVRLVIGQYTDQFTLQEYIDTKDTADQEADYYLDAAEAGFQVLLTAHAEYVGVLEISPDGAIQQVEWSGGRQGCITRIGRNSEFSLSVPKFKEKRRIEKQGQVDSLLSRLGNVAGMIEKPGGVR